MLSQRCLRVACCEGREPSPGLLLPCGFPDLFIAQACWTLQLTQPDHRRGRRAPAPGPVPCGLGDQHLAQSLPQDRRPREPSSLGTCPDIRCLGSRWPCWFHFQDGPGPGDGTSLPLLVTALTLDRCLSIPRWVGVFLRQPPQSEARPEQPGTAALPHCCDRAAVRACWPRRVAGRPWPLPAVRRDQASESPFVSSPAKYEARLVDF